jgi:hypothetical protein
MVDGQGGAGAVYVYTRSGTSWTLAAQLSASDVSSCQSFGSAVALSGDTIVVGACEMSMAGQVHAGAVYLFSGSGSTWSQQAEFGDPAASADDAFGSAVALDGDTALVGAPDTTVAGQSDAGSAYLFSDAGAGWAASGQLNDPRQVGETSSAPPSRSRDRLPWSVRPGPSSAARRPASPTCSAVFRAIGRRPGP